jgi:hypothetical protein
MARMNDLSLPTKGKFLTLNSSEIPRRQFESLPEMFENAQKMTACPKTARN